MIDTGNSNKILIKMKNKFMKKLFKTTLVAAFTVVAGYGAYISQKTDSAMSELVLANVEALARDEVEQIKCNKEMGGTCVLINNTPIPGEKYN